MDSEVPEKREKNPREDASWISIITFLFTLKIFRKGLRREIGNEDIYEIVEDFGSEKVGNLLEKEWEVELKKCRSWFLSPLFRIFWKGYAAWGISLLITQAVLGAAYPLLMGKLISYFTPKQTEVTINDALLYTAGIIGVMVTYSVFINAYVIFIIELFAKIKAACCALIYAKCLKLNLTCWSNCPNGLVVTLMTKDVLQFDWALDMAQMMASGVFQSIVMTYIMYNAIGVSALLGVLLLLVLLPVQVITSLNLMKIQCNYEPVTKRTELTSLTFDLGTFFVEFCFATVLICLCYYEFGGAQETEEKSQRKRKLDIDYDYITFRQGLRRELKEEDIYEIVDSFRSERVGNLLEEEWETELEKPKIWFLRPLLRIFWKEYTGLGISLLVMQTALLISYPLLTGKLVSYFKPEQTEVTLNRAILYTAGIVGSIFVFRLYINIYLLFVYELALKIKAACCALVYRKCLKLSLQCLSKCASGLAVTLMTKDVLQFDYAADFALCMIAGAFQVVIMIYMMYKEIGVAALLGTSLLLVFVPAQAPESKPEPDILGIFPTIDAGIKKKRETNPRENANFLSAIFFIFAFKTIREGLRKELDTDDIYEIMNDHRSEKLGDRLEAQWKKELTRPKPFFLRSLFRIFGLEYALLGLTVFCSETIMLTVEPIFIGKLVSYFKPKTNVTRDEAMLYAAGLLSCRFLWTLVDNTYLLLVMQLSMKIRIACCSLFYRKCLRPNLTTSQFAWGTVVTLMSKDVTQFDWATGCVLMILTGIVQVFIMMYFMYRAYCS